MTAQPDLAARQLPAASITITQAMIDGYAAISGDYNPLHVDPEAAGATPFGGTIAHGCIPMEPIFKAVQKLVGASVLPEGSRMSLRYHRPSRPGDTISIERSMNDEPEPGRLRFSCRNQNGETVIDGVFSLG